MRLTVSCVCSGWVSAMRAVAVSLETGRKLGPVPGARAKCKSCEKSQRRVSTMEERLRVFKEEMQVLKAQIKTLKANVSEEFYPSVCGGGGSGWGVP